MAGGRLRLSGGPGRSPECPGRAGRRAGLCRGCRAHLGRGGAAGQEPGPRDWCEGDAALPARGAARYSGAAAEGSALLWGGRAPLSKLAIAENGP